MWRDKLKCWYGCFSCLFVSLAPSTVVVGSAHRKVSSPCFWSTCWLVPEDQWIEPSAGSTGQSHHSPLKGYPWANLISMCIEMTSCDMKYDENKINDKVKLSLKAHKNYVSLMVWLLTIKICLNKIRPWRSADDGLVLTCQERILTGSPRVLIRLGSSVCGTLSSLKQSSHSSAMAALYSP